MAHCECRSHPFKVKRSSFIFDFFQVCQKMRLFLQIASFKTLFCRCMCAGIALTRFFDSAPIDGRARSNLKSQSLSVWRQQQQARPSQVPLAPNDARTWYAKAALPRKRHCPETVRRSAWGRSAQKTRLPELLSRVLSPSLSLLHVAGGGSQRRGARVPAQRRRVRAL